MLLQTEESQGFRPTCTHKNPTHTCRHLRCRTQSPHISSTHHHHSLHCLSACLSVSCRCCEERGRCSADKHNHRQAPGMMQPQGSTVRGQQPQQQQQHSQRPHTAAPRKTEHSTQETLTAANTLRRCCCCCCWCCLFLPDTISIKPTV